MPDQMSEMLQELMATTGKNVWQFLELPDVLRLSMSSKVVESFVIPVEKLNEYSRTTSWNGSLAVTFPHALTVAMFRRVMFNLHHVTEAVVQIEERTGRVLLDIGSAVHEDTDEDEEYDPEHQVIFKHLEHFSCDEYDDFNPRHPLPRDRAHRRGDSYFNSDIDMVVGELGNQMAPKPIDLLNIARAALSEPSPAAAGAGGAAPAAGGAGMSLKDRILAKKGVGAGSATARPAKPSRAVNALIEGSDDEH
jgi:hypothetical protein